MALGTTLTYGGVISGTGSVTQSGGGTLLLTGCQYLHWQHGRQGWSAADASSTFKIGIDNALSDRHAAQSQWRRLGRQCHV